MKVDDKYVLTVFQLFINRYALIIGITQSVCEIVRFAH